MPDPRSPPLPPPPPPDAFIRLVKKSSPAGVAAGVPTPNVDPLDVDTELAGVLTPPPDDPPELTLAADGAGEARSRIHVASRSGEEGSIGGGGGRRGNRPEAWSIARRWKVAAAADWREGNEAARSGKARRRSSGGMEESGLELVLVEGKWECG